MAMPDGLELRGDGGVLIAVPTFGLTLYTDKAFSKIPKAVLSVVDRFVALCPPDEVRWYGTENMSKHKAATKRTLEMPSTWLKPKAPAREYVMLEVKGGEAFNGASSFRLTIFGGERGSVGFEEGDGNLISMAFPVEWGAERTDEMLALFRQLCEVFPFQSAQAGYTFEWSQYAQAVCHPHIWAKSMQHRGIDIAWPSLERGAVKRDAVRGVGWLTAICTPFLDRLGGVRAVRAKLKAPAEVMEMPGGIIIKADTRPHVGDTRRNDYVASYQQVYRALAPLIQPMLERYPSFSLPKNRYDNTKAWLQRFANGG